MPTPSTDHKEKLVSRTVPLRSWRGLSDTTLAALLLLLAWTTYANSLTNGFVYDDRQQILQNPYVTSWKFLPQIFGTTVWSFVGQAGMTNYYRPLMTLSFLLLWKIFGPIPVGFHLFSLVLHSAVVLLVFFVGGRLFNDVRIGWLAALVFAVHPVHTEAVAWIASITDLEMTLFFLFGFWIFSSAPRLNWRNHLSLGAAFSLALLSKEPALMLLPLGIFFEFFLRANHNQTSAPKKLRRCSALILVAIAYLALRIALFGKLAPVLQHPQIGWSGAIYSAFASISEYFRLLIWPTGLSAFHVFHASLSLWNFEVLAGLCIFLASLLVMLFTLRRSPAISFCIAWIGFTLAPVLNARWMAANVVAERYLYLPSAGFCWLAAALAVWVWDTALKLRMATRVFRMASAAFLMAVIAMSILSTIRRNRVWASDFTLYTRTLETDPDADIIRSNLAGVYFEQGDLTRAEEEWKRALAGKPDNVLTMNALGVLYSKEKRYNEASAMFQRAIATKPLWGEAHYNYAILLHEKHDEPAAMKEFQKAIKLSPLSSEAHLWYGKALLDDGRMKEAEMELQRSLELRPSAAGWSSLADLYIEMGRNREAESALQRLLRDNPYDGEAHLRLARLFESTGQREGARKEYEAVLTTDPRNQEALAALARLKR